MGVRHVDCDSDALLNKFAFLKDNMRILVRTEFFRSVPSV